MDTAQGLLNAFGVSTPALERMVAIARGAGALGAKLSGAGGGGVIIALAPVSGERVAEALRAEGFEAFHTRIGSAIPREVENAKSNRGSA
jgi:mevalonate kinase